MSHPSSASATGRPEPGNLLSREILYLLSAVAKEGICGMEVVEVSPPYDQSEITALLATRTIVDVLGDPGRLWQTRIPPVHHSWLECLRSSACRHRYPCCSLPDLALACCMPWTRIMCLRWPT
ncbi:arginase family protein [Candidatus Macondimonas diazotrophica]|uniref:arginase family protein n=1 Tax=Candidatus Macondimonas diazotrophica TaxID=2305248 RepID=UPI00196B9077